MGDCKDRLIRNSIVAGLNSTKAYQQCISKGSSLTLKECIKIYQTEDATHKQVQALHPESSDCIDSTPVHRIAQYPQQQGRYSFRSTGAFWCGRSNHRSSLGGATPGSRLQAQYWDCMWILWFKAPLIPIQVQGQRTEVLSLWETQTLLKDVQTESREPGQWQDWGQAHRHRGTVSRLCPK